MHQCLEQRQSVQRKCELRCAATIQSFLHPSRAGGAG